MVVSTHDDFARGTTNVLKFLGASILATPVKHVNVKFNRLKRRVIKRTISR